MLRLRGRSVTRQVRLSGKDTVAAISGLTSCHLSQIGSVTTYTRLRLTTNLKPEHICIDLMDILSASFMSYTVRIMNPR